MDFIPPEYDERTRERVYRQEWLEYFHYIGLETAARDYPAQYSVLYPRGHQHRGRRNSDPANSASTTASTAGKTSSSSTVDRHRDDGRKDRIRSGDRDRRDSRQETSGEGRTQQQRRRPRSSEEDRSVTEERASRRGRTRNYDDRRADALLHRDGRSRR